MAKLLPDAESIFQKLKYFTFWGSSWSGEWSVALSRGVEVLLSRTGYTGELGFELIMDAEALTNAWEVVLSAGEADGLIPCGLASRDSLRAGAVLPLSHQDIGDWPFINHPWPFALPLNKDGRTFRKAFLGAEALHPDTAEHTQAFVGYDPRKVDAHGAQVLNEAGESVGRVLTCVADMAVGRYNGRVYSLHSPDRPDGFKARGLICGFVKVASPFELGGVVTLKDQRRGVQVEIVSDVRPDRTARLPLTDML
jgi:aminomethyltransferase